MHVDLYGRFSFPTHRGTSNPLPFPTLIDIVYVLYFLKILQEHTSTSDLGCVNNPGRGALLRRGLLLGRGLLL